MVMVGAAATVVVLDEVPICEETLVKKQQNKEVLQSSPVIGPHLPVSSHFCFVILVRFYLDSTIIIIVITLSSHGRLH